MKKVIRCFSIVLLSTMFMFLVCAKPASAIYDRDENTIRASVSATSVKIIVKYQKGIDVDTAKYYWCRVDGTVDNITDPSQCRGDIAEVNYILNSDKANLDFINNSQAEVSDKKLTTYEFVVDKKDDPILSNMDSLLGEVKREYVFFAQVSFCARRGVNPDETISDSCEYFDEPKYAKIANVNLANIANDHDLNFGGDISDPGLSDLMAKIAGIVKNTVMPILWAVLGLFLIVKGALLGVQIVKSADEPQVRQEKVGSLKWLVIGVAIAYASTAVVTVLMNFFDGTFGG